MPSGIAEQPVSTDDVVIVNEVTISTDQAIHSLSINGFGVLVFTAPVTLTINGDFSKDADAIFDPGNDWYDPSTGGTVVFGPGNNIINTHGQVVDFYNLSKVASGAGEKLSVDPLVTEQGGIHILHSLTLKGAGAGSLLTLASTTPGSQWGIWPENGTDVNYVNVQDSDNLGDPIAVAVGEGTNTPIGTLALSPNSSSVSLSASSNPSRIGQPVTFTATISPSGVSSGEVEFYLDGEPIEDCESVELEGGHTATCTVNDLALGSHEISADFSGNDTYLASTSSILNQVVDFWRFYVPVMAK